MYTKFRIYLLINPEKEISGFKKKNDNHNKYILYLGKSNEIDKHYALLFTSKKPETKYLKKYIIFNNLIKTKKTSISYLQLKKPYLISSSNIKTLTNFSNTKEIFISLKGSRYSNEKLQITNFLENSFFKIKPLEKINYLQCIKHRKL